MSKSLSRALLRSSSLIILISSSVLLAPSSFASDPLEVVVTADRSEVPLKNTGSAITVITSEEIEKFGSKNIADVLRTVPGLTIAETGGLGGETKVQLRGASPGASMVLLDGVRISDPSNTEGYFDFGNFSAANIERIEVLRGPQSALYGSDAMGGVINIITKKGKRTPEREFAVEGGSYGTFGARGSMSGATDKVSYSFGVNAMHSDGFPRYGYRVKRDLGLPPLPSDDPVNKAGLNGRIIYELESGASLETGMSYFYNHIQFDNPDAENPFSSNNLSQSEIINGHIKAKFYNFDHRLLSQLSVFGNDTARDTNLDYLTLEGDSNILPLNYKGKRLGSEYQGDYNFGSLGFLTFGARTETEFASDNFGFDGTQTTNSLFLQQRIAFGERLDFSLGGRIDSVEGGDTFDTWRSTAAYRIDETQTKIRSSIGTGAKLPTLYQQLGGYASSSLLPEKSNGFDFGFDQSLFDDAMMLSATYFKTDYRNRIAYGDKETTCPLFGDEYFGGACYYNIGFVASHGVEISAQASIVPEKLLLRMSYSHVNALNKSKDDLGAGLQIYRTPKDQFSVSINYTGWTNLDFEPRLLWVGKRLDVYYSRIDGSSVIQNVTLPAYLKLDFLTRYQVNNSNDAYIRFENLTNAHTEDVYNYGSAGRSVYVGWTSRW